MVLEREAPKGVRRVSVGMNGSYVVILNSGNIFWSGIPEQLSQLLDDAKRNERTVEVSAIAAQLCDGAGIYRPIC